MQTQKKDVQQKFIMAWGAVPKGHVLLEADESTMTMVVVPKNAGSGTKKKGLNYA